MRTYETDKYLEWFPFPDLRNSTSLESFIHRVSDFTLALAVIDLAKISIVNNSQQ